MSNCIRCLASVCGEYCGACEQYVLRKCRGCAYQLGLAKNVECAIFQCCIVEYGLEHCGLCDEFPCGAFNKSAPTSTIQRRLEALIFRREKGTDQWLLHEQQKLCVATESGSKSEPPELLYIFL